MDNSKVDVINKKILKTFIMRFLVL